MKKLISLLLLVALVGGVAWYVHDHQSAPVKKASQTPRIVFKKACDVFPLADAVTILGNGTTQTPSHTDAVTAQKSVTTCLYSYDPGSFSDLVSASLLLQGAPPAQAKQSFSDARPSNAVDVSGYGEQAYWDPNLGQLHILKGQYWLIIAAGSGPLNQRDLDLPRKIADIMVKRI